MLEEYNTILFLNRRTAPRSKKDKDLQGEN